MAESDKTMARELFELLRNVLFKSMSAGVLEKMDDYGLTLIQRNVLLYVGRNGGCHPRDIDKMFCLMSTATARILNTLTKKRLVTREEFQQDSRMTLVKITPKCKDLIGQLDKKPIERLERMVSEMSAQEKKTFKEGFQIYFEGLKRITQGQS